MPQEMCIQPEDEAFEVGKRHAEDGIRFYPAGQRTDSCIVAYCRGYVEGIPAFEVCALVKARFIDDARTLSSQKDGVSVKNLTFRMGFTDHP